MIVIHINTDITGFPKNLLHEWLKQKASSTKYWLIE